jgi:hypothetical protein
MSITRGADMTATATQGTAIREYAEAATALRDYEEQLVRTGRGFNHDDKGWAALLARRDAASKAIAGGDHFEADRLVFKAYLAEASR